MVDLTVGRIRSGDRDGNIWIGVTGDKSYDRLEAPLSGQVTHALILGDEQAVQILVELLQDELADDALPGDKLTDGRNTE